MLVVYISFHQLVQVLLLHSCGHHLQLALVVLFICQLAHLLMCTNTYEHTLQLALCDDGVHFKYSIFITCREACRWQASLLQHFDDGILVAALRSQHPDASIIEYMVEYSRVSV